MIVAPGQTDRDATTASRIEARADFDFIRYGNVWEDADVLCEALAPVTEGRALLSVASAGDNALALLTLDPSTVVAVDLSTAQLACVAIRIAAFRHLDHDALLRFIGVTPATDRLATWRKLRADVTSDSRAFWDHREDLIEAGIIRAGKFESYFTLFRRWVLPLAVRHRNVRRLSAARSLEEQRAIYERHWNTTRWRALFRVFFSRFVMGRLGRDPEFFREVEGRVAERILARTRHALTALPVPSNPYFAAIVWGAFIPSALPRYLRPEHHLTIHHRLDRLRLVRGRIEDAGGGPYRGFNLSDIFEYMSLKEYRRAYDTLLGRAEPGARLAYWNMLAARAMPEELRSRVQPLSELANRLHAADRAWFYSRFHVDEVLEAPNA